jgi:hypothetical protein
MFNIFINDIFDFVKKGDLHNYADDNTLSYGSNSVDDVIELNVNLKSKVTPKSFTSSSQSILFPCSIKLKFFSCVFLPIEMA